MSAVEWEVFDAPGNGRWLRRGSARREGIFQNGAHTADAWCGRNCSQPGVALRAWRMPERNVQMASARGRPVTDTTGSKLSLDPFDMMYT